MDNVKFDIYNQALLQHGITSEIRDVYLTEWSRPERVYHGLIHLVEMLAAIDHDRMCDIISPPEYSLLVTAAFVHDLVYVPGGNANEDKSINMYLETKQAVYPDNNQRNVKKVIELVIATKYNPDEIDFNDPLVVRFLRYDLGALCTHDVATMIAKEDLMFKEFQKADYKLYKSKRTEILRTVCKIVLRIAPDSAINQYIDYIGTRRRTIAVYPGTFMPFHKGHLNIVHKAEQLFDKVIVAPRYNPDKSSKEFRDTIVHKQSYFVELYNKIPNQVLHFSGFLHDLVKELTDEYTDVVIVNGLVRYADFENQKMEQRFIEDMYPAIKFVYLIPDREFEYISSSSIKAIDVVQDFVNVTPDSPDHSTKYKV